MGERYEELGLADPEKAAREAKLYACQKVMRFVKWMMDSWPELGRPINPNADILIHAVFARSTRTYEAVVKHLGNAGFGEQGLMLCRSLFEDMLDAHWISLNRDLAIDRIKEHDEWCTYLRRNVVGAFPDYFEEEVPDAPGPSAEMQKLYKGRFGAHGEKSWTGLSAYQRVCEVEQCWTEEPGRRQLRFNYAWVHRHNNETLHVSAYSLGRTKSRPREVEGAWHFTVGSTVEMLDQALFSAFWTYRQTLGLIFDEFELDLHDRFEDEVGQIVLREFEDLGG